MFLNSTTFRLKLFVKYSTCVITVNQMGGKKPSLLFNCDIYDQSKMKLTVSLHELE